MTQETRPGGSATSGDPHQILATLRPQAYGNGSPQKVRDPLIEPLWTGVRTLAAVDDGGATLVDADGEHVEGMAAIVEALGTSARADGVVLDGFLTKQTAHGAAVIVWPDEMPSVGRMVGLRRNRAVDTVTLKEEALAARTFVSDEAVSFVATDLLWLDDTSLLDVPLLERRRLLESVLVESDVVRVGAFIRPPIESWVSSWRSMGFAGLTYKAANSRYLPGEPNPDWVITGMPRR
jgi:bifunctional non-homologous end joining protein LigD